jgi:transposase
MRRIRQVLQLHFRNGRQCPGDRRRLGVGRSTVQDYLARVSAAGFMWPLAPGLTDEVLERRLFPPRNGSKSSACLYPEQTRPRWRAR